MRRLSELNKLEYERVRADSAKRHGVRVNFLDDIIRRAQAEAKARAEVEDDDPPYPEPVPDIAEVLDQALAEIRRYIVGHEPALAAVVVWSLHTHIVHHQHVRIAVSPKLAIQSPEKGCGKTTLLEIVGTLVPRAETSSSITAATIFRLIEARRPTLLIDEADRVLRSSNEELIAVLNSSHRRSGAYVWRVEEIARQRVPTRFSTWGAVAFAGIRELPETLQDRSIAVRLPKALPGEVRAHLSDGTSSVLRTIKAKFLRWAVDLRHLPEPELPAGLHNRLGDNWRPLVALADLAGRRWPGLIRMAALSSLSADQEEGQLIALLRGIQRAFGEKDFLETHALIESLLVDDEHDWETANNHKPINAAWLRWRLRGVLAPKADGTFGSDRRRSGKKERGYFRHRFEDAWARYTSSNLNPQNTRSTRSKADNDRETKENTGPDTDEDTRSKSDDTRSTEVGKGAGPDNGTDGPGTGPGKEGVPGPEKCQPDEELTRNRPDRPGISGDAESKSPPAEDSFPNVRRPGNGADFGLGAAVMPRNGDLQKPMTVERALAEAHKAGCVFRLAGAGIEVRGINGVPADIVTFLRGNRELVFDYLGGNERDRPSLELLSTLDIELVYCTDDVTAESVIAEIIADAGAGPIAIDIETTARPSTRTQSLCGSPYAAGR